MHAYAQRKPLCCCNPLHAACALVGIVSKMQGACFHTAFIRPCPVRRTWVLAASTPQVINSAAIRSFTEQLLAHSIMNAGNSVVNAGRNGVDLVDEVLQADTHTY